jgi:hypothetical protein
VSATALAGCGGAGYGQPIAATDGSATVALAPAPQTTPSVTIIVTTPGAARPADGSATDDRAGTTTSGGGSSDGGTDASGGGGSAGSSSGGSGSANALAAYAADANRFCTGFTAATRTLTTTVSAAGTSNPRALGRAVVRFGSAIDDAADGLRVAPPPSSLSSYHQRTLSWVSSVTSVITANRSGLDRGDQRAGAAVIGRVQALGKPPTAPAALRARATACTA